MVIEYSQKEMAEAIIFHYMSFRNEPENVKDVQFVQGPDGYFAARLKVEEGK